MKNARRIVALNLALLLILTIAPLAAMAATLNSGDNSISSVPKYSYTDHKFTPSDDGFYKITLEVPVSGESAQTSTGGNLSIYKGDDFILGEANRSVSDDYYTTVEIVYLLSNQEYTFKVIPFIYRGGSAPEDSIDYSINIEKYTPEDMTLGVAKENKSEGSNFYSLKITDTGWYAIETDKVGTQFYSFDDTTKAMGIVYQVIDGYCFLTAGDYYLASYVYDASNSVKVSKKNETTLTLGNEVTINAGSTDSYKCTATGSGCHKFDLVADSFDFAVCDADGKVIALNYSETGPLYAEFEEGKTYHIAVRNTSENDLKFKATYESSLTLLKDEMFTDLEPMTYTGSKLEPTVSVTDVGSTLTLNNDYTVSYGDQHLNNKDSGTGLVTISGEGNYVGKVFKYFLISPATPIGTPSCTPITQSGRTLASAPLSGTFNHPTTNASVAGTLAWDLPAETVVTANTAYSWTFTPSDNNYVPVTGSLTPYVFVYVPPVMPEPEPEPEPEVPSAPVGGEVVTGEGKTTLIVDQKELNEQIDSAAGNVTIAVPDTGDTAAAELVVKNVDDMAAKDMTCTIEVGNVQYTLPASAIDTQAILDSLGAADADDVPINISITTNLSQEAQAAIDNAISSEGATMVLPPVEFTITATYNGQTVEVSVFNQYVTRTLEVTAEQAANITTAVVVDPDGTTRQVPTRAYEKDGKWYIEVSSLTNSSYAFINNVKSFADAQGKWYGAAVNEMASRMIIAGIGDNQFAGDNDITRAEFAAIVVRALGLPQDGDGTVFSDVSASAWYCGTVGKAYEYGLVSGVGDGKFDPTRNITRQEAMLIVQRMAEIVNFKGQSGSIDSFSDADSVSDWALDAARWNVGSGLIVGSNGMLRPLDNITRAETATLTLKLLQMSGLVDIRTPLTAE